MKVLSNLLKVWIFYGRGMVGCSNTIVTIFLSMPNKFTVECDLKSHHVQKRRSWKSCFFGWPMSHVQDEWCHVWGTWSFWCCLGLLIINTTSCVGACLLMGVRGGHKQLSVVCVARHVMCGVQGRELYYKLRILRQFSLKKCKYWETKRDNS